MSVFIFGIAVGKLLLGVGNLLLEFGDAIVIIAPALLKLGLPVVKGLLRIGNFFVECVQSVVVFSPALIQICPGVVEFFLRVIQLPVAVRDFIFGVIQFLASFASDFFIAQVCPILAGFLQSCLHRRDQITIPIVKT